MAELVEVDFVDVVENTLILADSETKTFVFMQIGESEAFSIKIAVEGLRFRRPLSHDLMGQIIKISGLKPKRVVVHDLRDGAYIAKIYMEKKVFFFKHTVVLDSRPSDAVALALRLKIPIFVSKHLLRNPFVQPQEESPTGIEG